MLETRLSGLGGYSMTAMTRRAMLATAGTSAVALPFASSAMAQAVAAATPAPGAQWDLADLYPTEAAWDAEKTAVNADIATLARFKGTLGKSAGALLAAQEAISVLNKRVARLFVYATLKGDEDLRVARHQERRQLATQLFSSLNEATAWTSPELLTAGKARVDSFLAAEPRLAKFRFGLEETFRLAPHTLDNKGEEILAASGNPLSGPNAIRSQLVSSDIPWPEVTLSTGQKARLDAQGYTLYRDAPNRADRKLVFDTFWKATKGFENSLGATLTAKVQGDIFTAKARNYPNSLQAALAGSNIPEAVYRTLIAETNRGLPTLHRYFALRQRMLKLPDIGYWDIYPPLVSLDRKFTLADMRRITLEANAPLGRDYLEPLARGTAAKWMDPFPRPGKAPGAYNFGAAYDVHPYLLLNLKEDYSGLTTYAHEWGHAVHSVLANTHQPWDTANYSTFTAELASTGNEQLLIAHMLKNAKTREEKLFYLGQQMEGFRGTFFRQAMFAEFELKIHDMAEAGEALSGETFTRIYGELLRKYHGPAMKLEPDYSVEWAYIAHFLQYNFYVFQYATSVTGSVYFADRILNGGAAGAKAFVDVLKAGGSDHPYFILKRAGLDLASPAPYRGLVAAFDSALDQVEKLI